MLWFVKGTLRRSVRCGFVSSGERSRNVLLAFGFKVIEQANKLLCGVRHCNVVMLALTKLLLQISGKVGSHFQTYFAAFRSAQRRYLEPRFSILACVE